MGFTFLNFRLCPWPRSLRRPTWTVHTATAIPFIYSGELRGLSPNFHIHVSVSDLYIPRIGPHISSSRKGRPIAGIHNSLTDTRMWKLGLRPRYSFSGNICFKFSAFCLCSAVEYSSTHLGLATFTLAFLGGCFHPSFSLPLLRFGQHLGHFSTDQIHNSVVSLMEGMDRIAAPHNSFPFSSSQGIHKPGGWRGLSTR